MVKVWGLEKDEKNMLHHKNDFLFSLFLDGSSEKVPRSKYVIKKAQISFDESILKA